MNENKKGVSSMNRNRIRFWLCILMTMAFGYMLHSSAWNQIPKLILSFGAGIFFGMSFYYFFHGILRPSFREACRSMDGEDDEEESCQ